MINYNDYTKNNSKVRTGLVKDNLNIKTKRSGVVLYTKYADTIYFCFGRDSKTHDLSDFGGRTENSESAVDAAIREFQEETLGVFKLEKDDILESFCIYDRDSMVIMVRIDESPNTINDVFNEKAKNIIKNKESDIDLEICGMVWIDFYDMMVCLHTSNPIKRTGVFFHRLELLFRKVKNIHLEL